MRNEPDTPSSDCKPLAGCRLPLTLANIPRICLAAFLHNMNSRLLAKYGDGEKIPRNEPNMLTLDFKSRGYQELKRLSPSSSRSAALSPTERDALHFPQKLHRLHIRTCYHVAAGDRCCLPRRQPAGHLPELAVKPIDRVERARYDIRRYTMNQETGIARRAD
jgi:hypothetical protein